jgi:hypothetical protein
VDTSRLLGANDVRASLGKYFDVEQVA